MEFIFWFIVIALILGFFGSRTNSTTTSNNNKVKPKKDSDLLDLLSKKYNDTKEKIDSKLHEASEKHRKILESYLEEEKRNKEYESFGITKKDRESNYMDEKFFEYVNRILRDEPHKNKSIVILNKHHIDRIYHVTSINNWMNIKMLVGFIVGLTCKITIWM